MVFRPLIGWATAWSFDRLRLWLESKTDPSQAARQTVVHGAARLAQAGIFAYHGLVPKLLGPHPDEVSMLRDAGVPAERIGAAVSASGVGELFLAFCLLWFWRRSWPPVVTVALMIAATIGVALSSPQYLRAAFNPLSLNLAVGVLALIDVVTLEGLPSASRCLRRPPREDA